MENAKERGESDPEDWVEVLNNIWGGRAHEGSPQSQEPGTKPQYHTPNNKSVNKPGKGQTGSNVFPPLSFLFF